MCFIKLKRMLLVCNDMKSPRVKNHLCYLFSLSSIGLVLINSKYVNESFIQMHFKWETLGTFWHSEEYCRQKKEARYYRWPHMFHKLMLGLLSVWNSDGGIGGVGRLSLDTDLLTGEYNCNVCHPNIINIQLSSHLNITTTIVCTHRRT